MNRPVALYPWTLDWGVVIVIFGAGLLAVLGLYLAMRSGRMERENKDTPGKPPIHDYAGLTRSDSNAPTVFIWLLIVFLLLWSVWYVLNITFNGLGY